MVGMNDRLHQTVLMAALVFLTGCGGHSAHQGAGGAGGSGAGESGAGGSGVSPDSGVHQDAADASGDLSPSDGSSTDALCDTDSLWSAVADAALGVARLGFCAPAGTASPYGQIALDSTGRVVDNTGTTYQSTSSKQAWLDSLANDRWPCLAGQTIPYQCAAD